MKNRTTAKTKKGPAAVSLAASALLLLVGLSWPGSALTIRQLLPGLALPLLRLMFFLTAGLAAAQAMEAAGWTKSLGKIAGPLFRFAHLPPQSSAAFSTAFFSGAAANAMLWEFFQTGKITKKQLVLSNLINQFPAFFLHLPTVFFIVVPLAKTAGLIYLALTLGAALLRIGFFTLWGRLFFPPPGRSKSPQDDEPRKISKGGPAGVFETLKKRLPRRVRGVAIWVLPIYTAVFVFNRLGGFAWTREWMAQAVALRFVPMESLSIVILSFAAEFSSGFAAAGALMDAGVLNVKQAVLALLVGNVTAFPVRALRHQLPRYLGVFSPRLGAQILFMGQGFRVASLILAGTVFYFLV